MPATQKKDGLRILVVDDARDQSHSLAMLLRQDGHQVEVASDGFDALTVVQWFEPQAILLDLGMPRLDGLGLARRLRANPATRDTLLVAISGFSGPRYEEAARTAGCHYYLVKPVPWERVLEVLAEGIAASAQSSKGSDQGSTDQLDEPLDEATR